MIKAKNTPKHHMYDWSDSKNQHKDQLSFEINIFKSYSRFDSFLHFRVCLMRCFFISKTTSIYLQFKFTWRELLVTFWYLVFPVVFQDWLWEFRAKLQPNLVILTNESDMALQIQFFFSCFVVLNNTQNNRYDVIEKIKYFSQNFKNSQTNNFFEFENVDDKLHRRQPVTFWTRLQIYLFALFTIYCFY